MTLSGERHIFPSQWEGFAILFSIFAALGASVAPAPPTLLKGPAWEDYAAAAPSLKAAKLDGRAILRCQVSVQGSLEACTVPSETPADQGLKAAALSLVAKFQFAPAMAGGSPVRWPVDLPLEFRFKPRDAKNGYTPPEWLERPSQSDLEGEWPAKALREGVSGKVELHCVVNAAGLLEACRAESEKPEGFGFGQAAAALAPRFRMRLGVGPDGKKFGGIVSIPVTFSAPPPARDGIVSSVKVVNRPVYATAPEFDDLARVYPARAKGTPGQVVLRCKLQIDGALRNCETLSEVPHNLGFGRAALSLAPKFRLRIGVEDAKLVKGYYVDVPFRMEAPTSPDMVNRSVPHPTWIASPDGVTAHATFPKAALDKGVTSGRGFARCVVAPEGTLVACQPLSAEPEGLGFAEAAVEMAKTMRMNAWTQDGGPVGGAHIRIPFRFVAPSQAKP